MPLVTFRITLEWLREDIDIASELEKLGENLFLVLHEKPGNYHYHGLLEITTSTKTLSRRIKEFKCPNFKEVKGFRYVIVSDKVENADAYKSYCLYRPGHPIKEIYVKNENIKVLKDIAHKVLANTAHKPKDFGKLDKDLKAILARNNSKNVRNIAREVVTYYKELGRVLHVVDIQRLIWSVYTYTVDMDKFISHLFMDEKGGLGIIPYNHAFDVDGVFQTCLVGDENDPDGANAPYYTMKEQSLREERLNSLNSTV